MLGYEDTEAGGRARYMRPRPSGEPDDGNAQEWGCLRQLFDTPPEQTMELDFERNGWNSKTSSGFKE